MNTDERGPADERLLVITKSALGVYPRLSMICLTTKAQRHERGFYNPENLGVFVSLCLCDKSADGDKINPWLRRK
jgi:hypothetical protein